MAHWNTRGLRGSAFEELVSTTNQLYRKHGLALVQKVPTPITPVEVNNRERTITRAYFGEKSTVDYIGVVQGIPVCFDVKETQYKNFPLKNIHQHQIEFMEDFIKQEGAVFLLVNFKLKNKIFFLKWETLKSRYDISVAGGRKSVSYDDFEDKFTVNNKDGFPVHYLEPLNLWLTETRGKL